MTGASWHDEAITTDAQDEFGRVGIADHIADLIIANHSWEASRVYGLTGPWGSGKSSVINLVCDRLERRGSEDERWVVAQFTPWATSSTDALLVEFYASLSAALGRGSRSRQVRKLLGACLQAAAPALGHVPYAGSALSWFANAGSRALDRQESWVTAFSKFTAKLHELDVRILVVADDIDRLQHDELVTLLKVVRLLGRFPGVDYMLAYDERTLFSNLKDAHVGADSSDRARLFMEKIVQYPIALPPLLAHQILSRLDRGFTDALDGRVDAGESLSRIEGLQDLFVRQLGTPRSIDRYLAQVRFVLSMHSPGEIDEADLMLVTLLHLQFPAVYERLPRWRGLLTGHKSLGDMLKSKRGEKTNFSPLLDGLDGDDTHDAGRLVGSLFPAFSESWGRGRPHICDHLYFDRYFVHMVPDDDIADATVVHALEVSSAEGPEADGLRSLLTDEAVQGLPDLALDKLRQASSETPRDESGTLNLIASIMDVLPSLENGANTLFRRQDRAIHWASELVRSLPEDVAPEALAAALSRCDDLPLKVRVVWDGLRGGWEQDESPAPARSPALASVATDLAGEVVTYCLDHLRQRDRADVEAPITLPLMYVVREGDLATFRARVQNDLDAAFTAEDLAARCVTLAYPISRQRVAGRLEGFVEDLFRALVPADDPFYDEAKVAVDPSNLAWENRRAFARGRARRVAAVESE